MNIACSVYSGLGRFFNRTGPKGDGPFYQIDLPLTKVKAGREMGQTYTSTRYTQADFWLIEGYITD